MFPSGVPGDRESSSRLMTPARDRIASPKGRILVVDDQWANLRVLETVLDIAGYKNVRCLDDSREVLPVVAEFSPDLIMLDLHMPHVDGLAVMDQLGEVIPQDDYVPILVLTGDASARAAKIYQKTLDEYEPPPLDDAIRAELEEYVIRRRAELGD